MKNKKDPQPPGWTVTLSIGMGVGWLIFLLIWLAFFAGDYSIYENFAIILISILFVFIILGGSWASWGLKQIPTEGKEVMKVAGFTSRIVVSIIVPFILFIFWIIWFFYYAEGFDIYQNIAIFIVSLLALGGVLGGIWASWGMKNKKKLEEIGKLCEDDD